MKTVLLNSTKTTLLVFTLITSLFLSGCGGGGSNSESSLITSPIQMSGSLETFLKAIEYGSTNDGQWTHPTNQTRNIFTTVVDQIFDGNFNQVHNDALTVGYELLEYTDAAPNRLHYILREIEQVAAIASTGGGT